MKTGLWRSSRALVALAVFVAAVVAASGYTEASNSWHGDKWLNVALPTQSVWTTHGRMTVTPIAIGPYGAKFRVRLPEGYALARHNPASLTIANRAWPFDKRASSSREWRGRVLHLAFDKGGPAIGWVKLTIKGSDGKAYVLTWFLPGGGI
jgi:hypothetical protein